MITIYLDSAPEAGKIYDLREVISGDTWQITVKEVNSEENTLTTTNEQTYKFFKQKKELKNER